MKIFVQLERFNMIRHSLLQVANGIETKVANNLVDEFKLGAELDMKCYLTM